MGLTGGSSSELSDELSEESELSDVAAAAGAARLPDNADGSLFIVSINSIDNGKYRGEHRGLTTVPGATLSFPCPAL